MSNNNTLSTILKLAGIGVLTYAAYKFGQKSVQKNIIDIPYEPTNDTSENDHQEEEKYIKDLISELSKKPNKTKKDKYNIELLQVKLNQLRNKK